MNFRNVFEKFHRIVDGHIQDLRDILFLVVNFQGFAIVTSSMADFTSYVYIWQEVHFNLDNTITRAGLTATALDIKTKTTLLIATNLGFICLSEEVTNIVKYTCIGSRVRPRCSSNWTLINVYQTIDMLNP